MADSERRPRGIGVLHLFHRREENSEQFALYIRREDADQVAAEEEAASGPGVINEVLSLMPLTRADAGIAQRVRAARRRPGDPPVTHLMVVDPDDPDYSGPECETFTRCCGINWMALVGQDLVTAKRDLVTCPISMRVRRQVACDT